MSEASMHYKVLISGVQYVVPSSTHWYMSTASSPKQKHIKTCITATDVSSDLRHLRVRGRIFLLRCLFCTTGHRTLRSPAWFSVGRGDDTVAKPSSSSKFSIRAFELKFLNSSFSSLSSYWDLTNGSLLSNSRQVERFQAAVSQSAEPSPPLLEWEHDSPWRRAWRTPFWGSLARFREQHCDMSPSWDPPEGISFSNESIGQIQNTYKQHTLCFKGFHLKRKSPQGDLNQETYRNHHVLRMLASRLAQPLESESSLPSAGSDAVRHGNKKEMCFGRSKK